MLVISVAATRTQYKFFFININPNVLLLFSGDGEQTAGRWKEHHRSHQRAAEDAGDETAGDR